MKLSNFLIFALLPLFGCCGSGVPEPGSDADFVDHSAVYVCGKGESQAVRTGEPVYIRAKGGADQHVRYFVDTYADFNGDQAAPVFGAFSAISKSISIPQRCAINFVNFKRADSLESNYFAFDISPAEKEMWAGTDSFTYEDPAQYLKFMPGGRVELGSYAERKVDDSSMPDHLKHYGWVWEYGDFYYARIDIGDGQHLYVAGGKKDRKIVSVFGGKPLASNGVQSTRSNNDLGPRSSADGVTASQGVEPNCENRREVTLNQRGFKHSLTYSIQGKSCMSSVYTVEITSSTGQTLYSFSRNMAEMYVSHATTNMDKRAEALKEAKILIHGISLIPIVDAVSPIEEEGQDLRIDAAQAERLTQSNDWAIGHPESFEGHSFIAYDPELNRYVVVSLIGS
ncbi:hypothetical protein [Pseudoxanthomonas sp. CF125]|uniref:hypothetical protein n=1 Tax=Pseudoxanthomonas sp. CF125 TaxID=1855303 RepID=UPI000891B112|nr:hypothetical protein [Pseudoxanthomonas sp. CF125]SDR22712.1 hypothetical protein SAMN05216569_3710 [Pseudoxanthomonas sp. CF125]